MSNRLAGSTSPYLLQHQNNPVDWYPWSTEAIDRAKREDKPIFLSIGYSACHWCHVMEHESFENVHIAKLLNDHFVSIKVDREQRPDLDQIYMQVVQMLTGSGGWPMSVFLTPDMKPFYGGTYWPPENRWGRPGFDTVLRAVLDGWQNKRESILEQSDELVGYLNQSITSSQASTNAVSTIDPSVAQRLLASAESSLGELFDSRYGGFGGSPKFPHATDLRFLLQRYAAYNSAKTSKSPNDNDRLSPDALLRIVTTTLDGMSNGGIYDHLGGGFARYSVDEKWLVPHFEKMLYDNALLASAFLDAFRLTRDAKYSKVVHETLDYVLSEMTDSAGGFYSAEDADSEGEEGKFYVWSMDEIESVLGSGAASLFCEVYGVTAAGNFEGHNILHLPQSIESVARSRSTSLESIEQQLHNSRILLLRARQKRTRPGRDDKVLVSWNALMIYSMADAGVCLKEKRYLVAAQKAADFIFDQIRDNDGRLLHVWRDGKAEIGAFLDDYSYLSFALIKLWECDGNPKWLEKAIALVDAMISYFEDPKGGFYFTARDAETLIARAKDSQDGSVPSGNAMAVCVLVKLWQWTEDEKYRKLIQSTIDSFYSLLERAPGAAGQMLIGIDQLYGKNEALVVISSPEHVTTIRCACEEVYSPFRRQLVLDDRTAVSEQQQRESLIGHWLQNRTKPAGADAILYRCIGNQCDQPLDGKLEEILKSVRRP